MAESGPISEATRLFQDMFNDKALAAEWHERLKGWVGDPLKAKVNSTAWLLEKGYKTNLPSIELVTQRAANATSLGSWAARYNVFVDNESAGTLEIKKVEGKTDLLKIFQSIEYTAPGGNPVTIKKATYKKNELAWKASDGNPNSANLTFKILTTHDDKPLNLKDYVGCSFTGTIWGPNAIKPEAGNAVGRFNQKKIDPAKPEKHDTLTNWAASYVTVMKNADGKWEKGPLLVIEGETVSWNGVAISGLVFTQNTLSWNENNDDNNTNGSLLFSSNAVASKDSPYVGAQFFGKVWNKGADLPGAINVFGHLATDTGDAGDDPKRRRTDPDPDKEIWETLNHILIVSMLIEIAPKAFATIKAGLEAAGKLASKAGKAAAEFASECMTKAADLFKNFEGVKDITENTEATFTEDSSLVSLDSSAVGADGELLPEASPEIEALLETSETIAVQGAEVAAGRALTAEEALAAEEALEIGEALGGEGEAAAAEAEALGEEGIEVGAEEGEGVVIEVLEVIAIL